MRATNQADCVPLERSNPQDLINVFIAFAKSYDVNPEKVCL
ncbi:hypothetical protein Zm00014a_017348 [Zea mays]|uniref:Uncharacterized protein n=1 Tax=Zea mays TaxID=4577 RepID=A0A3L6G9G5_MAIZE|nr:hypothetical protein Zm00014a_017348 [Zea mays]